LATSKVDVRVEELCQLILSIPRIDAIDVPELVDENHDGRPYYRSGDVRAFAQKLGERTGRDVIINKVVAHVHSTEALTGWLRETVERGIHHAVLVGGSSRYIPYPGPAVTEANRLCVGILKEVNGSLGNIAIPQRIGEAHRMLSKTRAGASFFTTQIVFDADAMSRLLVDYERLCQQAGLSPATVLISVAPIADEGDAEFVRWLGADFPEAAEQWILNSDESGASARSVQNALSVWGRVTQGAAEAKLTLPVGVNVEQLSPRHLSSAGEMLRAFSTRMSAGN
jgi:5,10-methylenetetrahydrofolate reductase